MLREKSSKSGTKCVFLDLSKAFDTIDHEILLSKMDRLGMRGNVLNWFRSYLSDRKQFVVVNEPESAIKILNKGVPQGSIVGPVIFIIYMNDLSEFCIQSKPTFFADDTTLLVTSPNKDLLNKIMAKELKVVNNWLATNKLCLNVGKTKCVSFKVKSPQNLFLDEMKIQECKTMKYLGVHIDNELKFLDHIDSLKKKLSKAVGIASQLRYFVSRDVLLKNYNFYVKPILQYGILVYGCTYITHLKKIALMQRKLLRLIFFKRKTMSIESEMINAHILSVPQLYVYELIKFAFRSVRKEVSSDHLNNLYTRAKSNCSRSNKKTLFQLPLHSNNWEKHSLRYRGTNILNF